MTTSTERMRAYRARRYAEGWHYIRGRWTKAPRKQRQPNARTPGPPMIITAGTVTIADDLHVDQPLTDSQVQLLRQTLAAANLKPQDVFEIEITDTRITVGYYERDDHGIICSADGPVRRWREVTL